MQRTRRLVIAPRNTKSSSENIPLLEKGELDLALVAGEHRPMRPTPASAVRRCS